MVTKFEFNDYTLPLEIGGILFELEADTETGAIVSGFGKEATEMGEKLRSGELSNEDCKKRLREMVDTLLGDKATERIFEASGAKQSISNYTDILVFIANTISDFNMAKRGEASNRATRRAAARKAKN